MFPGNNIEGIEKQKKMKKRDFVLDLFRIIAVLMVFTVHSRGYLHETPRIIDAIFGIGAYGVALYFVISGYLTEQTVGRQIGVFSYYKSRCVRILPMYYVALLLTFFVMCFIKKQLRYHLNGFIMCFF